jgi:hypothetical protein
MCAQQQQQHICHVLDMCQMLIADAQLIAAEEGSIAVYSRLVQSIFNI